jgi:hypothetical protein
MVERVRANRIGLNLPCATETLDHVVRHLERGEVTLAGFDTLLSQEFTLRENRRIKVALHMFGPSITQRP